MALASFEVIREEVVVLLKPLYHDMWKMLVCRCIDDLVQMLCSHIWSINTRVVPGLFVVEISWVRRKG